MSPATQTMTAEMTTHELPGARATTTSSRGPATAHRAVLRRIAGTLRRALQTSYYDPSFERPDVIEDDHFRFRHHPRD